MEHFAGVQDLYFGGDMEAAIPLSGQVVGRIDEVKSAADIVKGVKSAHCDTCYGMFPPTPSIF